MEFNFIVLNGNDLPNDPTLFFDNEPVEFIKSDSDIYDILVRCGIFKSKNQARKNWKRTGPEIPAGFNDFEGVGKLKHRITILNP